MDDKILIVGLGNPEENIEITDTILALR